MSLVDYLLNFSKATAITRIPVTFQKQTKFIAHRFLWLNGCSICVLLCRVSLQFKLHSKKPNGAKHQQIILILIRKEMRSTYPNKVTLRLKTELLISNNDLNA
jgi:hypothetical protein